MIFHLNEKKPNHFPYVNGVCSYVWYTFSFINFLFKNLLLGQFHDRIYNIVFFSLQYGDDR